MRCFDSEWTPGWRFQVWVRQTVGGSEVVDLGRVLSVCMLELCVLPELHLTSTHTYSTVSHLSSLDLTYSTPLTCNPFQSLHLLPPLHPVSPRSAYRKHLASPALRGPRITKLHVGITFRRATAIPWIPPHSYSEFPLTSIRMAGATIPA